MHQVNLLLRILTHLNKIWSLLDGNKSLIGMVLVTMDGKILQGYDEWYVETGRILIYTWTGIGFGDKIRKGVKKGLDKRGVKLSEIQTLRKPINLFRNRRR